MLMYVHKRVCVCAHVCAFITESLVLGKKLESSHSKMNEGTTVLWYILTMEH